MSIGKTFKSLGVDYVVAFDEQKQSDGRKLELMPLRFDLIYKFCVEFYAQLLDQNTIADSFKIGKEILEKDESYSKLKITPILLTESDTNKKFFIQEL